MGLDSESVILPAVFAGDDAAVEIDDTVFLAALILQIAGRDNAHDNTSPGKNSAIFYTGPGIFVNPIA